MNGERKEDAQSKGEVKIYDSLTWCAFAFAFVYSCNFVLVLYLLLVNMFLRMACNEYNTIRISFHLAHKILL